MTMMGRDGDAGREGRAEGRSCTAGSFSSRTTLREGDVNGREGDERSIKAVTYLGPERDVPLLDEDHAEPADGDGGPEVGQVVGRPHDRSIHEGDL